MITIDFISAKGCKDCDRMRKYIEECIESMGLHAEINEMDSDDDSSVDFAIGAGIDDIPACEVYGRIVQGRSFTKEDIEELLLYGKNYE